MSRHHSKLEVATTVLVDYRIVGGWHVFASEQMRGLYVAHADQRTAYEAICPSIERLLAENEHVEVKACPALPFDSFLARLHGHLGLPEVRPGKSLAFTLVEKAKEAH